MMQWTFQFVWPLFVLLLYMIVGPVFASVALWLFVRFAELLKLPERFGRLGAKVVSAYRTQMQ